MKRILPYLAVAVLLVITASPRLAVCAESNEDEAFVVIKAARIITVAGTEHTRGEIVVVNGKIRLVGRDLEYPKTAKVIDARRQVVMPGMILARTRWQLPSYSRSGAHGDRNAKQEIYLQEMDLQPLLKAGFTAAAFYPAGTGMPGRASIFRAAGKDDQRDLGAAYLRVTMSSPGRDKKVLRDAVAKARKEIEKVEKARKDWEAKQKKAQEEAAKKKQDEKPADDKKDPADEKKDDTKQPPEKKSDEKEKGQKDAKTEQKKPETFTPPKIDPAVKPLVDWIRDKKGPAMLFELGRASDLRHLEDVLKGAKELPGGLIHLASYSSSDFHHVVADLGKTEATVLLRCQLGTLPYTATQYNLPAELAMAGCKVALLPRTESPAQFESVRTYLADLVRAGLPREVALRAVTLHAAEVLGMEDRLGTIEKGKDADLIFLDRDPLAPESRVTRVMTLGETVWEAPKRP